MDGQEFYRLFEKADWMTVVILIVCFFVWSVWQRAGGFLEQKTSDIFHSHQRKSLFAVDTLSELRLGIIFSLVYGLIFSLYLHHQFIFFGGAVSFRFFLICLSALFAYHGLKILLIRIAGLVFDVNLQTKQWIDSYIVLNHFVGLVFIPLVIGITYGSQQVSAVLLNGSIFVILIYLIFLLIRFFNIFYSNISSIIYVFLYFCTLEILPLAIFVKLAWLR